MLSVCPPLDGVKQCMAPLNGSKTKRGAAQLFLMRPRRTEAAGHRCRAAAARCEKLEHFQEKWTPVFRQKMRPLMKK